MTVNIFLAVCFLACLHPIYSVSVPFITKCKVGDSKCIKSSTQAAIGVFVKGIPELGVETLDPFIVKHVDGSSSNLKLKLNDLTITGIGQCQAKKVQVSEDKKKLILRILCTVEGKGLYDIDGNILLLKVVGNGNVHVVLRKVQMTVEADLSEKIGSDGENHWSVTAWKHEYELKDKATVELDNLFEGNEVLGRAAKDLIESSPNEIIFEVGPPIIKAICSKIVHSVNKFFEKVPLSQLIE